MGETWRVFRWIILGAIVGAVVTYSGGFCCCSGGLTPLSDGTWEEPPGPPAKGVSIKLGKSSGLIGGLLAAIPGAGIGAVAGGVFVTKRIKAEYRASRGSRKESQATDDDPNSLSDF